MAVNNTLDKTKIDLSAFYKRFVESFLDTINNPYADPTQSALLICIILIGISIIGLLIYLIFSTLRDLKKPKLPKVVLKRPQISLKERLIGTAVAIVLIMITALYSFDYISQPHVCIDCHKDKKAPDTEVVKHKGVKCISCHEQPGVSGYLFNKLDYARWFIAYTTGNYTQPLQAYVTNEACLRCHQVVTEKTVVRYNIRVSHKEFLATNMKCVDCHANPPHTIANKTRRLGMDKCIGCHNSVKASSDCALCHTNHAKTDIRTANREFIRIDVRPLSECRSCHPPSLWQGECIRCHGLEMPHPAGWREGSHARLAFTNRKLCDKCHPQPPGMVPSEYPHQAKTEPGPARSYFCNRCHAFPSPHGSTENWIKQHGPAANLQINVNTPVCLKCHGEDPVRYCAGCHGRDFCDRCHNDGRRGKAEGVGRP
ncbi:MAG: cytochrome c3 family protein [Actinomycetota bacterium]